LVLLTVNQVGSKGALFLAQALRNNTALLWLNLNSKLLVSISYYSSLLQSEHAFFWWGHGNRARAAQNHVLAVAGPRRYSIFHVSAFIWIGNKIGEEGAVALAKALQKNTCLLSLTLLGTFLRSILTFFPEGIMGLGPKERCHWLARFEKIAIFGLWIYVVFLFFFLTAQRGQHRH
jgi:hypothetical protein